MITNLKWWKAAGIRAIKTMAQTAAAAIGTTALIEQVDWRMVCSTAILAGVLSILTSVAGLPEVKMAAELEELEEVEVRNEEGD